MSESRAGKGCVIFSLQYTDTYFVRFQDPNTNREGGPLGGNKLTQTHHHNRNMMFSTKQYIVIMLAFQIHHGGVYFVNPTLKQISNGLKFYAGINITVRQVRSILHDLESDGIIQRQLNCFHGGPLANQGQASSYKVIDFNKAFHDIFSLMESFKVILAREKRLRKRKEA